MPALYRMTVAASAVYNKGRDAQIVVGSTVCDAEDGRLLGTTSASMFVRGEGAFGEPPGRTQAWEVPSGTADHVVTLSVPAGQALLYRLSDDRNPLHSDPTAAAAAGFPRPILHGLCTFGYADRPFFASVRDGDVARFSGMAARFTASFLARI